MSIQQSIIFPRKDDHLKILSFRVIFPHFRTDFILARIVIISPHATIEMVLFLEPARFILLRIEKLHGKVAGFSRYFYIAISPTQVPYSVAV